MQVLGDLIRLPADPEVLPLPWWHRAPLGLLHGTDVYVALVDSGREVLDLIVSVLDPNNWEQLLRVQCRRRDEPGVIARALDVVYPLNVVLAETVTLETHKQHEVTLICEVDRLDNIVDHIPRVRESLIAQEFRVDSIYPFRSVPLDVQWTGQSRVEHGWLREVPFLPVLQKRFPSGLDAFDLQKAVVSADTEKRLLRYIFPRKGVLTVKIQHADKAGALRHLCRVLADDCDLNVLSALLRRGGQKRGSAELVTICEPNRPDCGRVEDEIRKHVAQVPQEYQAKLRPPHPGRRPEDVVRFVDPGRERGGWPVFVATRFARDADGWDSLRGRLKAVLERSGLRAVFEAAATPERRPAHRPSPGQAIAAILPVAAGLGEAAVVGLASDLGGLAATGTPALVLAGAPLPTAISSLCAARGIEVRDLSPSPGAVDDAGLEASLAEWLGLLDLA